MTPSDDDLNGLLKTWTAPKSPSSLERRIRRGYRERMRSRTKARLWTARLLPIAGKLAGAMAAAVVLLAVITQAFPQSLNLFVPPGSIMIESEFLEYRDDGSVAVTEYRTSSLRRPTANGVMADGGETVLSRSFPGHPLRTAAGDLIDPMLAIFPRAHRLIDPLLYKGFTRQFFMQVGQKTADRIRNGCTPTTLGGRPMTVIGHETILGYATTVSQSAPEVGAFRLTLWFAPQLDCHPLASKLGWVQADGAVVVASGWRALKVTSR